MQVGYAKIAIIGQYMAIGSVTAGVRATIVSVTVQFTVQTAMRQ